MYNKIYDLCAVKVDGGAHKNGQQMSRRGDWINRVLQGFNFDYHIHEFTNERFGDNKFFNFEMKGTSNKMVVAHYDIVNPGSDNANDNSCSVINAIMVKQLMPEVNVVILDGEEPPMMGVGSTECAKRINDGVFGDIEWVLNLELTGKGGESFFIGNYPGKLLDKIKSMYDCPIFHTPFNDTVRFREAGIDSVVINPLPITDRPGPIQNKDGEYLDFELLYNCHSMADSVDTIDPADMQAFVEKIVLPILR